jgi:hypothetical protein
MNDGNAFIPSVNGRPASFGVGKQSQNATEPRTPTSSQT